jgi:hypothetical protein
MPEPPSKGVDPFGVLVTLTLSLSLLRCACKAREKYLLLDMV